MSEPSVTSTTEEDTQSTPPSEAACKRVPPHRCRDHIRNEAGKRWVPIVTNLLLSAERGSVPHIALVAKLAGFEQGPRVPCPPKRRTKSLAQELREEMEALEARNIAEFGE